MRAACPRAMESPVKYVVGYDPIPRVAYDRELEVAIIFSTHHPFQIPRVSMFEIDAIEIARALQCYAVMTERLGNTGATCLRNVNKYESIGMTDHVLLL